MLLINVLKISDPLTNSDIIVTSQSVLNLHCPFTIQYDPRNFDGENGSLSEFPPY